MDRNKKIAFTLAEVLITLGVIGLVAAITLPTVIKNYQKHVWVNQLKSTMSLLEEGFKRIKAVEGVDYLQDTSVYQAIGGDYGNSNTIRGTITLKRCNKSNLSSSDNCKDFFANLGKYIKIVKIEDVPNQMLNDKSNLVLFLNPTGTAYQNGEYSYGSKLILANGAIIWRGQHRSVPNNRLEHGILSDFWVDINGTKAPNTMGRDIFSLAILDDGRVIPTGSKLCSIEVDGSETNWHWSGNKANANCYTKQEGITSYGHGCAARIMENGWKMDY